jgi:histone acetyltransferase (RNA polymerase elongator complex component)
MPQEKLTIYSSGELPVHDAVKPFIIPVFLPHAGCPHPCVFCNQNAITRSHSHALSLDALRSMIRTYLNYPSHDRKPVQIAFFGGNFLGIDGTAMRSYLSTADAFVQEGLVDGIRFSTRPDTVTQDTLAMIKDFPVSTIEIGAQSMVDGVLRNCRRGHSAQDTVCAAEEIKAAGYELGIQLMIGLPGDDDAGAVSTASRIVNLTPDFVRIYPTVVLKNSPLARWYQNGDYTPLSLESAVSLVKKLYLMFQENRIPIIRMGLQASEELEDGASFLAGPYHPAFGHLVTSAIYRDRIDQFLESKNDTVDGTLNLMVNPRRISTMRGMKNETIMYLQDRYCIRQITVIGDEQVPDGEIRISMC